MMYYIVWAFRGVGRSGPKHRTKWEQVAVTTDLATRWRMPWLPSDRHSGVRGGEMTEKQ